MGKKLTVDYPLQMGSMKKGDWRLDYKDKNGLQLLISEYRLWNKLLRKAKNAPVSPKELHDFSDSKLIGEGWEWSVYETERRGLPVIKVPRGVFPEVGEREYLENIEKIYKLLFKYFPPGLIAKTEFGRKKMDGRVTNVIFQELLVGKQLRKIRKDWISEKQRGQLVELCEGMLKMLEEEDWVVDVQIYRRIGWRGRYWNAWNLRTDANGDIKLFDFSGYYDGMRLYPRRMKLEKWFRRNEMRSLLRHLRK